MEQLGREALKRRMSIETGMKLHSRIGIGKINDVREVGV